MTYLAERNSRRYAAIGRNGRKNCRVSGMTREVRSSVATIAFGRGPGDCIMVRAKMPMTANIKYCPSRMVHLWVWSAFSVS